MARLKEGTIIKFKRKYKIVGEGDTFIVHHEGKKTLFETVGFVNLAHLPHWRTREYEILQELPTDKVKGD